MQEALVLLIGVALAALTREIFRRAWCAAPTIRGWIRLSELRAAFAGCFFFLVAIAVGLSYTGQHREATYVAWYGLAGLALGGALVSTVLIGRARTASHKPVPPAERQPELTTITHRNEIREIFNRGAGLVQIGLPYQWGDELRRSIAAAHYPGLVEEINTWSEMAESPRMARQDLRSRLKVELESLALEDNFDIAAIVEGFAVYTEYRSAAGHLSDAVELKQLWEVYRPTHGPADGAHIRGFRDVAIFVDNSIADPAYTQIAMGMIDRVKPVFDAAQGWPEATAIADAQRVLDDYDTSPLLQKIRKVTVRERIATSPGCPVCGEVG